jgi:hypothetical protein
MFARSEDVTKALLAGETTVRKIRNRISYHRVRGNVPAVMMFLEGIEWYLYEKEYKPEE